MLFSVFKKSIIWIILIATLAAGAIFALGAAKRPVYYSYSDFYVINTVEEEDFTQSALVSAAKAIANDYIEIIKSDKMLFLVCDELEKQNITCTVD
jgi:capsular polysaccharide biosynthesis protein